MENICGAIGFDFILDNDKNPFLLELQFPFGFNMTKRLLDYCSAKSQIPYNIINTELLSKQIIDLSMNKWETYKLLSKHQPKTIMPKSIDEINDWGKTINSKYIICKPFLQTTETGYEGIGIWIVEKKDCVYQPNIILQEFIDSFKVIDMNNNLHRASIRHMACFFINDNNLNIVHFPNYWRINIENYLDTVDIKTQIANVRNRGVVLPVCDEYNEIIVNKCTEIFSDMILGLTDKIFDINSENIISFRNNKWYWSNIKTINIVTDLIYKQKY